MRASSRVRPLAGGKPSAGAAGAILQAALRHHQAGALEQAEPLYRSVPRQDPAHADAQNLLGLLLYQRQEHAAAIVALRRAVQLRPGAAEYHRNLGMALRAAGQLAEATAACRRAIALQPGAAESHFNLGNTLADQGEQAAAVAAFTEALRLRPDFLAARLNLARALLLLKRHPEAEAALRRVLEADPGQRMAHYNLGLALLAQERWAEAEQSLHRAQEGGLDSAPLWLNLGMALQEQERWAEAEAAYRAALARQPELAEAWLGLGLSLQAGQVRDAGLQEAGQAFARAAELQPDYCAAFFNLYQVRRRQGDIDGARAALDRAVALQPEDGAALTNLANLLGAQGWPEQALPLARRACELLPGDPIALTNYGRMLLLHGQFAEGWDAYERRSRDPEHVSHDFGLPAWQGEALEAPGRVLIWREQGVGDEVMFCSLLPEILAAGHRVTLVCDGRLEPAFARAFPDLVFMHRGPPGPEIKAQISMASLPRLFRRSAAAFAGQRPYLTADPALRDSLRARYADGRKLVGLAWHTQHPRTGYRRNIPLRDFAPLLALPGIRWVSLQYGDPAALQAEAAGLPPLLIDPDLDARDSIELAFAQVAAMDHVVTIDNSTAHFAGALGRPCEVLLPLAPDWRWLTGRTDSLWYPGMRLWRRRHDKDWGMLLAELAAALPERLAEKKGEQGA